MASKILIVDDEQSIRHALREILEEEKYKVEEANNGEKALEAMTTKKYDVVLLDIKMPEMDGLEVLDKALQREIESQFIMISAHGTIETAVDATKKGAFDFVEKPPDLNKLLVTIRNAIENANLRTETKELRQKVAKSTDIIGESNQIQEVLNTIEKVAPTDARVLVTGSNGSGKELVAKQLHHKSQRADMPLIEVNCAAIPGELIESELFGHEKGAFTTAIKQRAGKFEQANGGTIFLDEIGDMSLAAQAKVLRALQEKKINRVGSDKDIEVDVRVVAATNKNINKEISEGNFREDLYHRLAVIIIHVPSLDERKEDIPLLITHFLKEIAHEYGSKPKKIDTDAVQYLQEQSWPGNIRELRNAIERLFILSNEQITLQEAKKNAGK